jgi:hypothetical protein
MRLVAFVLLVAGAFNLSVKAQNPELQQRLAEVKQAMAQSQQAPAQYTWVEQATISLKGEQKKQEHFQVRLGPDGKPQKTSLNPPANPQPEGGKLKRRIVEKKKEEYKDYAVQMKSLAQEYVPPDKDMLQQAHQQGNITMGPVAENPNAVKFVIKNYLKQGDSMTLIFDKAQKELLQVQIASYVDDPKDAMNLSVQFSKLPNGPNHVASLVIDGVSKQLNVATQNSNYQQL